MNKEQISTLLKLTGVLAAIYMFLVGINGMSSAIKHMGSEVAESIFTATSNPFVALFIGVFSTVLFQSSSTTTSLIVGMVSSGALGLSSSIPMIMGANIGTTVTNTIVSIGHINRGSEFKRAFAASTVHDFFNILAVIILFPLEITFHWIQRSSEWFASLIFGKMRDVDVLQAKSPIKAAVKSGAKFIEQFTFDNDVVFLIVSVLITFIMLYSLVKLLKSLVLEKIEAFFDKYIFKTALRAVFFWYYPYYNGTEQLHNNVIDSSSCWSWRFNIEADFSFYTRCKYWDNRNRSFSGFNWNRFCSNYGNKSFDF